MRLDPENRNLLLLIVGVGGCAIFAVAPGVWEKSLVAAIMAFVAIGCLFGRGR